MGVRVGALWCVSESTYIFLVGHIEKSRFVRRKTAPGCGWWKVGLVGQSWDEVCCRYAEHIKFASTGYKLGTKTVQTIQLSNPVFAIILCLPSSLENIFCFSLTLDLAILLFFFTKTYKKIKEGTIEGEIVNWGLKIKVHRKFVINCSIQHWELWRQLFLYIFSQLA